jgi:dynein heavy chain, axonemal
MLSTYFCPEAVENECYSFTEDGNYVVPPAGNLNAVREFVKELPVTDTPETFGLHRNAATSFENSETKYFIDSILSIQPRVGGSSGGKSSDDLIAELADDLASKAPALLTTEGAADMTFTKDDDGILNSLGTFLSIEMEKFNRMLEIIKSTIFELQRAIRGLVVMSSSLDMMYQAMMFQRVPDIWSKVGYLSLKPLGSWFKDLLARIDFIGLWIMGGPPHSFWMSAFFFPQGFMTAAMQMYARSQITAIDTLDFRTEVMEMLSDEVTSCPKHGVYFHGAYLEGARWNRTSNELCESNLGEMHVCMPVIWLEPIAKDMKYGLKSSAYDAPFYKVSSRAGTLSTTGHSTNFVRILELPSSSQDVRHWIRRSVALLSQLDD